MVTITRNSKWIIATNFENVSVYEDTDHELNFYGEAKL